MAQFIAYSIGVFLLVIILVVIVLLVAKKYLSPSGNVNIRPYHLCSSGLIADGYIEREWRLPALCLWW